MPGSADESTEVSIIFLGTPRLNASGSWYLSLLIKVNFFVLRHNFLGEKSAVEQDFVAWIHLIDAQCQQTCPIVPKTPSP